MIHIGSIIQEEALNQRFTNAKIADIVGKTPNGVRKQLGNMNLSTHVILTYCKLLKINFFYKIACHPDLAGFELPKVKNPLPVPTHLAEEPSPKYGETKYEQKDIEGNVDLVSITITLPRHKSEKILQILQSK